MRMLEQIGEAKQKFKIKEQKKLKLQEHKCMLFGKLDS